MSVPANTQTIPVRVRVREVGYNSVELDVNGNAMLVAKRGYGPGQPQLNPDTLDLEPDSEAMKDAVDEFERGQIIYLLPEDYRRHMKFGVVRDIDTEPETAEEEQEQFLNPAEASVDDLVQWIKQERPTVNDVVQASVGDPAIATKLMEAESKAQDGEPRVGVVQGLTSVIQRGQTEEEE